MRVASNLPSINTINTLKKSRKKISNSVEKLSTGLNIREAADDVAGLSISEKMRAQIRGLHQAGRNIQEGVSLVQTAEGGLCEIHEALQRMRELCIQASNDIYTTEDRESIQLEIDRLNEEINSIANNTHFNNNYLLNVDDTGETIHIGNGTPLSLNVDPNGRLALRTIDGYSDAPDDDHQKLIYGSTYGSTSRPSIRIGNISYQLHGNISVPTILNGDIYETIYNISGIEVKQSVRIIGKDKNMYEIKYDITNHSETNQDIGFLYHIDTQIGIDDHAPYRINGEPLTNSKVYSGSNIPQDFVVYDHTTNQFLEARGIITGNFEGINIIEPPSQFAIGQYSSVANWDFVEGAPISDSGYHIRWNPRIVNAGETFSVNTFYGLKAPEYFDTIILGGVNLQVGANSGEKMTIFRKKVTAETLNTSSIIVATNSNAQEGLKICDSAIQTISQERSKYGSYQNALERIHSNVLNYGENITASESRIRDTDMAKEMMNYMKNNILLQVSQTMLAQTNQEPESILRLLK